MSAGGAHRVVDHRSFAGGEAQLQTHGLDRQQQIGENDGRVYVQNLDRLKRHLGGQVGPLADLQDASFGPDVPVLLHIPAGLPHEPTGRTSVGRRRQASRKRLFIGATRMYSTYS